MKYIVNDCIINDIFFCFLIKNVFGNNNTNSILFIILKL